MNLPQRLIIAIVISLAAWLAPQASSAQDRGASAPRAPSAQNRELSGREVVAAVCARCHQKGLNGAPRIGDKAAWAKLASRGLTGLTQSALKGVRLMPAHGDDASLGDIEVERAITYMVNQSGGKWTDPVGGVTPAVERRGEQVVQAQCAKCHQNGEGGAPRIGDRDAWVPRLKRGLDLLVRSAINGHGPMPPRGGIADLTDSEIRGAIVYMFHGRTMAQERPAAALPAAPDRNRKIVDGTEVYLGIVPSGKAESNVNISLFDSTTRAAITGAKVQASVSDPVSGAQTKSLEPMTFNNVQSYGNSFRVPTTNPYTIMVRIQRPGQSRVSEVPFEVRR